MADVPPLQPPPPRACVSLRPYLSCLCFICAVWFKEKMLCEEFVLKQSKCYNVLPYRFSMWSRKKYVTLACTEI